MKLFNITSKALVFKEPFVDLYEGETPEAALEFAKEDAHRYGLPADTTFEVIECNPVTLKPIEKGGAQ